MNKKITKNIINNIPINLTLKSYILFEKKKNIEIEITDLWLNFYKNLEIKFSNSTSNYNEKYITEIITNSFKNTWYFMLKNNSWLIKLNDLIKEIYNNLMDLFLETKLVKNYTQIILDIIYDSFNIILSEIPNKNKKTNKSNALFIELNSNDIKILNLQHLNNLHEQFYIDKKPLEWIFINKKTVILSENNSNFKKNIINYNKHIQDIHIKSLFNKKLINYINTLQNIDYKLDINTFNYLFSNNSLIDFYKKENKFYSEINNYEKFLLENQNDYLINNDIQKFYLKINNIINYEKNYINEEKELISNNEKRILNFIYNYNNEWLSNNLIMDYRGRLYILGSISYIASKLFRLLVILEENKIIDKNNQYYKYYIACQIDKPYSIEEGIIIYNNINLKLNSFNNNLNFQKIYIYNNGYISLDATASMLQIISLLIKNSKLMKYSNLTNSDKRYDIYEYIMKIVLEKKEHKNFETFIEFYKNKSIYKYCIMIYIYGSTPLYTAKKLIELKNMKNIHIKDITNIITIILNTFNKEFPFIKIFKSIIKSYANLIKYERYYKFKTILKELEYSCPKEEWIRLKNKNNLKTTFKICSEKTSYEDKIKSSFVNIIHSLDSEIAILTRIKLLEKYNIKSLSIHDCFIIHINDYEKCLECYNESLYEILKLNIKKITYNDNNLINIEQYWINKYEEYIFNNDYFLINILKKMKNKKYELIIKNKTYISNIRKDNETINNIKLYINKYIKNIINKSEKNYKILEEYKDYDHLIYNKNNIKYSLKPQ